jgi:transposase-like protein
MESMGKKPRRRRSFTPEFKAEIVETAVMTPRNNTAPPYAVTA